MSTPNPNLIRGVTLWARTVEELICDAPAYLYLDPEEAPDRLHSVAPALALGGLTPGELHDVAPPVSRRRLQHKAPGFEKST